MENQSNFPVKSFYNGATKKHYLKQLREKNNLNVKSKTSTALQIHKSSSCHQIYNTCFAERVIWKYFPRQQHALDYIFEKKLSCLKLFAYEKEDGKRKFLVTTQQQFWRKYQLFKPIDRHYYEVITQDSPCRLYFDIEFQYEYNRDTDGVLLLDIFLSYVSYCLNVEYGITCSRHDFVDMDSSTDRKFSRHVVFHLSNDEALFMNNHHCGEFVNEICSSLNLYFIVKKSNKYLPVNNLYMHDRDKLVDSMLEKIFVNTDLNKTYLCDLSVYSKNRNFRLYLSSKVSKLITLQIANENKFIFKTNLTKLERQIYKIRNMKFDSDYQKFQDTLICPYYAILKTKTYYTFNQNGDKMILKKSLHQTAVSNDQYPSKHCKEGSTKTDYPPLDKFVLSHVNKHGSEGYIRRWMLYRQSELIIYDIDGTRWCGNIQREHKSNHVYYVADLKFKNLYQKCFDPDCSFYRSPEIHIPDEVNPFCIFNENLFQQCDLKNEIDANKCLPISSSTNVISNTDLTGFYDDKELGDLFNEEFDICSAKKTKNNNCNKISEIDSSLQDIFQEEFIPLENSDALKTDIQGNVSTEAISLRKENSGILDNETSFKVEHGVGGDEIIDEVVLELFNNEFEFSRSEGL